MTKWKKKKSKFWSQMQFISIQIEALRHFTSEKTVLCLKVPQTQLADWSRSNYTAGGNMGGNTEANEVKGPICNLWPVQMCIVG